MDKKLFNTLLTVLGIGVLISLLVITFANLTANESTLLSLLLTILSFIASWMVSQFFADRSHKLAIEEVKEQHLSDLRTYALNAAEKVSTLSSELSKLSIYLQQELEDEEDEEDYTPEELYMSSYERIESAIHIINTLKSVNDTYLSDWKGVIGEELDAKFEEQQEKENNLRLLVEKVEHIIKARPTETSENVSEVQKVSRQINDLRKDLNLALNSVSGTFVRPFRVTPQSKKQEVALPCPYCDNQLNYRLRPKKTSSKVIPCSKCNNKSLAKWNQESGFILEKEVKINETYNCPWCNEPVQTTLSNFLHSKSMNTCTKCKGESQIIRTVDKFNIHQVNKPITNIPFQGELTDFNKDDNKVIINEDTLTKIKNEMPVQPWPKGTHKVVAEKLGLELKIVRHHISELIRRGEFKPQIDGVLYEPIKNVE
jgi:hypothetical protein